MRISTDNWNDPHIGGEGQARLLSFPQKQPHKEPRLSLSAERKGELTIGCVKLKGGWEGYLEMWRGVVGVGGIIKLKSPALSVHSIRKRATGRKQTKQSNKRWTCRRMRHRSHLRFVVIYGAQHVPELPHTELFLASACRITGKEILSKPEVCCSLFNTMFNLSL